MAAALLGFFLLLPHIVAGSLGCDPSSAPILGGWAELEPGGAALRYRCPQGQFPSPTARRRCGNDGQWEPMGDGTPKCKAILCPPPQALDHGVLWPLLPRYPPGVVVHFRCFDGFYFRGSPNRTCGVGGKWTGTGPVCDDGGKA
ncbi:complement factor B-like protease [Coturnix japonica]|uniref:complement factor B-like protease n=1 Tax=Coturnix japonica TaxID=93934 RepID=UPI000777306C|nr:complement factor B-like protease [Coturnix japonica]